MLTLRCTRKLLDDLQLSPAAEAPPSTTRLGDWYGNLLVVRRQPLVLLVSARTLLPVLVPARERGGLVPRLLLATRRVLLGIGVDEGPIDEELAEMAQVVIAGTSYAEALAGDLRPRQVLGVMSDFAALATAGQPSRSLLELSLFLANTPCSPLWRRAGNPATAPSDATVAVFGR